MRSLKGKTFLTTGASGFIGSHLIRKLLEKDARVHVFLKKDSNLSRIEDILGSLKIWHGDIMDLPSIRSCIRNSRPEIICHLAAVTNVQRNIELIDPAIDINIKGTINLIRALIEENISIERFINSGSSEEYGNGNAPFTEEQREIPVSPYSASKVAATHFCQMLNKTMGLPIVTLRPFLIYGPRQDANMFIPSLISHCLRGKDFPMTKGDQTRDFCYITDVVDAFIAAACRPRAAGEVINIGSGIEYRIREVAERVVNIMGNPIKLLVGALPKRAGEARHFFCNNKKAKKLLGWSPQIGLEEGLEKTIGWYRNFYSEHSEH